MKLRSIVYWYGFWGSLIYFKRGSCPAEEYNHTIQGPHMFSVLGSVVHEELVNDCVPSMLFFTLVNVI